MTGTGTQTQTWTTGVTTIALLVLRTGELKKGENDKYFKINLHERMLPSEHVTPDHQSDAHPAEPPGPAHTPQPLYDTIVWVHSINRVS